MEQKPGHNAPPAPAVLDWDVPAAPTTTPETLSRKVYDTAKACLGQDLSTDPAVPPEVSCAVAVNTVFKRALGAPVGGGASTEAMYSVLAKDPRFEQVTDGMAGDIIISPSGTSTKGALHGHVGICGINGVMSNNSMNGLWQEYYTVGTWKIYYGTKLGFPVLFFRLK